MSSIKERLSFEQLKQEPCFTNLTPKQRLMIETFIASNGDRVLAVKTAYNAKTLDIARVMAYELFENPKIIACLAIYFQDDPLDVFKRDVQRAWRNKRLSIAQVQAMKLYCDVNGWGSGSLPNLHGPGSAEPARSAKQSRAKNSKVTPADPLARVPEGATPLADKNGIVRGYKTADGNFVQLANAEAL
jgi:hypothetical protein